MMEIRWPRGRSSWLEYFIFNPFGIRICVQRGIPRRTGFACQMGMLLDFVMQCSHNHVAWREFTIYFRHVQISMRLGKAKQLSEDQCGGTGFWQWPKQTLKNRLHHLFDRCWYNAKNDFGREMAAQGMELTRK